MINDLLVNKQQLYDYYRFGYNFNLLRDGRKGVNVETVIDDLTDFLQFIESLNLAVTRKACMTEINDIITKLDTLDPAQIIMEKDSNEVKKIIGLIETTLNAELQLKYAYTLTDKKLGLTTLMENVGEIFSHDIFNNLPDLAKFDFEEAGKSIAFERSTAAAFHVLRGTEECLRFYYKSIIKKKRLKNLLWKPMTDDLRLKSTVPKALLDACDYVRINFRNPTAHPEAKYTLDEAQSLFSLCADIVNRLITDLKVKKKI